MRVPNLRVCDFLMVHRVAHVGRRATSRPAVVPSSRRGNTSSVLQRKENWAARKWSDDSPHLFLPNSQPLTAVKGCARVTGKAGENGQHSAEGRQLTLDETVGSRKWRHIRGLGGWKVFALRWGSSSKRRLRGRLGHRPVALPLSQGLNVQSGLRKDQKKFERRP